MAQQISESELILMKIIWKNEGSSLYSLIMEELEKDKNEWKNNTVLTLLSRLVEKKFLKIKKIGRRNEYTATVTEAEYQAMQTHRFLDKVYGGNVKNLVSTLLRQDILSADELKEIETFWRNEHE
ncbi:BlaI/MecI/CopY family transcriptional regulator [Candidatus Merdisoma sp. JLR.KK006]|uniref:BlaI/MecI/CopY family transcriptional regulator n=1 Tax=Candidatus Merdisoma sp. JLR.KK006 TaxID=3112626 RepID=UPI002FF438FB